MRLKMTNRKICLTDLRGFAVGAVVLMASPVLADPSLECSVTTSSQVETAECLIAEEERVGQALEAAIRVRQRAAEQIDNVTERELAIPALAVSQEAWLAYRDAECNFKGTLFAGGSGGGIAIRSCRVQMTRDRIDALLDF